MPLNAWSMERCVRIASNASSNQWTIFLFHLSSSITLSILRCGAVTSAVVNAILGSSADVKDSTKFWMKTHVPVSLERSCSELRLEVVSCGIEKIKFHIYSFLKS